MAAVAQQYRKTKTEIYDLLKNTDDRDITPEVILMIDYAFHNTEDNYEDGLSFLDRLHRKLSLYYPIQWNIANLKSTIRNSNNPSTAFVDVLNELLTYDMVACYGV